MATSAYYPQTQDILKMTILKYEPLSDNLSIGELAKYDSKVNMLETFRLIGVGVAKSWDKTALAAGMDIVFEQTPALFANIVPKEEGHLFARLLDCKQDEYVTCPADESKFLMLQKLHLVVTYRDKGTWHIYMPDKIRHRLNDMVKEDLKRYPEIEEMHHLLEQITTKRDRLYHLLDSTNPDNLTKHKAKELSVDVEATAKFFGEVKPRLKEIEKYLEKNTDTKLDAIWQDIQTTEMYIAVARTTINMVLQGLPLPVKEVQPTEVVPMNSTKEMRELTLKVQLNNTPIYRTFKVIDRCSLFELNMLIQFCFDWHDMRPHAFKYQSLDGEWMVMSPTTRLSDLMLDEGEKLYYLYDSKGDKWEHTLTVEAVDDYEGNEDDYEPRCISGSGPDPGERSGGNAWAHRNFPYIVKNKKKYSPFSISIINDSFHLWWTIERKIWIQQGIIKYAD